LAEERGEWAGYPIPVEGINLVVEKRHPMRHQIESNPIPKQEYPDEPAPSVTNDGDKKKLGEAGFGAMMRWHYWMNTLAVAADEVWSVDAEIKAMEKLQSMTTRQAFKCYVLSGSFLETSAASNTTYLFRKLRPTIAMKVNQDGNVMPTAVLCLHPIAYYQESWAGAMVPTDDVIAHLMLMRGDEHKFWCKSNHHDIRDPTAGF